MNNSGHELVGAEPLVVIEVKGTGLLGCERVRRPRKKWIVGSSHFNNGLSWIFVSLCLWLCPPSHQDGESLESGLTSRFALIRECSDMTCTTSKSMTWALQLPLLPLGKEMPANHVEVRDHVRREASSRLHTCEGGHLGPSSTVEPPA